MYTSIADPPTFLGRSRMWILKNLNSFLKSGIGSEKGAVSNFSSGPDPWKVTLNPDLQHWCTLYRIQICNSCVHCTESGSTTLVYIVQNLDLQHWVHCTESRTATLVYIVQQVWFIHKLICWQTLHSMPLFTK